MADEDFNTQERVVNNTVAKAGLTEKYHVSLVEIGIIGAEIMLRIKMPRINKDKLGRKP